MLHFRHGRNKFRADLVGERGQLFQDLPVFLRSAALIFVKAEHDGPLEPGEDRQERLPQAVVEERPRFRLRSGFCFLRLRRFLHIFPLQAEFPVLTAEIFLKGRRRDGSVGDRRHDLTEIFTQISPAAYTPSIFVFWSRSVTT